MSEGLLELFINYRFENGPICTVVFLSEIRKVEWILQHQNNSSYEITEIGEVELKTSYYTERSSRYISLDTRDENCICLGIIEADKKDNECSYAYTTKELKSAAEKEVLGWNEQVTKRRDAYYAQPWV